MKRAAITGFRAGSSNQISNVPMSSLIRFLNSEDVVYYDWNVSAGDAANAAYTPEELVENVVSDVSKYKTSVVLLHDSEDSVNNGRSGRTADRGIAGYGCRDFTD